MTITVEIQPEIRGEIDSIKLARLLTALNQVSGIFVRLPTTTSEVKSAILHTDDVALAATQAKFLTPDGKTTLPLGQSKCMQLSTHSVGKHTVRDSSNSTTNNNTATSSSTSKLHPLSISSPAADNRPDPSACSPESVEFHTPQRPSAASDIAAMTPPSRSTVRSTSGTSNTGGGSSSGNMYGHFADESGNTDPDLLDATAASFSALPKHTPNKHSNREKQKKNPVQEPRSPEQPPQQDPNICTMRIDLLLPMLALDLMYDVEKGYHLVLEVKTMRTTLSTRPLDRSIKFELESMSMHDNFRATTQSHLIWTPPNSGKLLEIS